jgi:hypothetical protein
VSILLPFVDVVFEVIEIFDFLWDILVVIMLLTISWASLLWILTTLGWRVSRGKKMGQERSSWKKGCHT